LFGFIMGLVQTQGCVSVEAGGVGLACTVTGIDVATFCFAECT